MKRYKLILKDKNIFHEIIKDFSAAENFKNCSLQDVIIIPEINCWEIKLKSPSPVEIKNLSNFLSQKFSVNAKIFVDVIPQAETKISPTPQKFVSPVQKISNFDDLKGDKIFGKKITEPVTEIMNLKLDKKSVICGEIGSGDKNGVTFREFKTGSGSVTFSLVDATEGIICKKLFRKESIDKAKNLAENLKSGMNLKISGVVKYDEYLKENIFLIDSIEEIKISDERTDDAKIKRTELHVHTTMSIMDAVISAEKLVTTAANWNWKSIAITDHGVVQAFPEAAKTAEKLKKKGKEIKIIYGMEGYLELENEELGIKSDEEEFFDLKNFFNGKIAKDKKYLPAYHIILLAKNKVGLKNLYQLVSMSQLRFYNRTPRIPKEVLKEFREGLIIGSACEAGELIRAIVEEKPEKKIEEIANFYDYLEIQPIHNNDFLKKSEDFPNVKTDEDLININKKVAELAKKLNKPLVATCDAHFLNPKDSIYRAILMYGKGFEDAENQPPLFLRTTDEMLQEFSYLDEKTAYDAVVTNPNKISDEIEFLKPIPEALYSPSMPGADEEIREMSYKKAKYIYGENLPKIVEDRLEQELKPIIQHGFSSLYLIAQRLVKKSNDDGYLVGSRGSVGSSFVATMTGITEVNPLPPHYRCKKCNYSKFFTHGEVGCGYDLENKNCPVCGYPLTKDGHDIPFAVFLGFDGDKVPDIDLNFSGEYQPTAHKYTEILFGRHNVYRAGTITTVAEKTAFGLVKKFFEEKNIKKHGSYIAKISEGCQGVKKTTGQHPAGIMVVPRNMDIHYFTPIQHPADDKNSETITTHFDYHSISSRLVKLDILGHDDPTVIKMLEKITHRDPQTIPLDDKPTMKIFNPKDAIGIPEFRTSFTRQMIADTNPKCFSDLVRISGFSHGTDVWLGNAQDLIKAGHCTLKDAISARDDIMMYLIHNGIDELKSFKIMENVRKGKGISEEFVEDLKSHKVPDWYIDSCQKIKYLFPRAHATAYVMMAYRIAYCKVHYPLAYYAAYFSIRADEFDANEIVKGESYVDSQIKKLENLSNERKLDLKESGKLAVFELAKEMFSRGFGIEHVDLYKSDAERFIVLENSLLPPLASLDGVGQVAAKGIEEARKSGKFTSIEDLQNKSGINKTSIAVLKEHGCLNDLDETDQISLFMGF